MATHFSFISYINNFCYCVVQLLTKIQLQVYSACWLNHYTDVIMTEWASQITSLTIVYSAVYSGGDQRKLQSSASLAFVWGIHRDRWIPRTKGQLRGKCFHLMTSSCLHPGTGVVTHPMYMKNKKYRLSLNGVLCYLDDMHISPVYVYFNMFTWQLNCIWSNWAKGLIQSECCLYISTSVHVIIIVFGVFILCAKRLS